MCTLKSCLKKMNFIVLLLAALGPAQADSGKENPSGILGKLPMAGNLAWERYKIEGFAWPTSVKPGENIKFYVSVMNQGGQNYQIEIFRIPKQDQADVLWTSATIAGNFYPLRAQNGAYINPGDLNPPKPVDFKIGCKSFWESGAIAFTIPTNWQSGVYYARLNHLALPSGDTNKYYYIPFVVRPATAGSTSRILFKFDLNTFQAYNYWGGGSLYSYPQDALTLTSTDTIAMDRPIRKDLSDAVSYFITPFAKTLEDSGYVMEYCNNIDLDSTSATGEIGINLLNKYKMLVLWNHDEYWSDPERTNTITFKGQTYNGNIARFAPNTCYWRVNWLGSGHRKLFCRKDNWPDPQNHPPYDLWREPPPIGPGLPEAKFLGEQYETGYNLHEPPEVVYKPNHWIFSGTGLQKGQQFGFGVLDANGRHGIVAGEIDNTITGRADFSIDTLAQRKVWSVVSGGSDSLWHQMVYYEDSTSNARVFASGAGGWWLGLADNADHPDDVAKMRIITINIFSHFSGKKYLGKIYADLIWGDDALEISTRLDGDTFIQPGKKLTLTNNFTLTIDPGVTLYVDGTLVIGKNVTITGGGQIVTRGSGKILPTNSATALASNNSRKLTRDVIGNYHLVFETEGEVCYEKLTSSGAITEFRRLSNGVADGVKSSPCIDARDGNILVVWQKNTGSSHDITFHKSTDYGATWPTSNRIVIASAVGSNPPLPVIVGARTNEVLVVYRIATNLSSRASSNYGSTWGAITAVPSSGSSGNSPALAANNTNYYSGNARACLVNAATGGNGAIFYRYYKNGPDSTGWGSLLKNLSIIVPGSYTGHKNPSLAPKGNNSVGLHVAWEANSGSNSVIIHRKATDYLTWPNVYSATYYEQQQQPSITGLQYDTAELLFKYASQNYIYKMHYDGTYWNQAPVFVGNGVNPSASIMPLGTTGAKYVWTAVASPSSQPPYEIKLSSETLTKSTASPLATIYHRSIAVIDTTADNWLEVRIDKLAVQTKSGEELTIPFAEAKEDDNTLTPANAFANLASSPITLPFEAESLFVHCQVNGQGLSAIKKRESTINVEIASRRKTAPPSSCR